MSKNSDLQYGVSKNTAKPVHLAIIMDGNNRWAKHKGLDQISGHREGALKLRKLIEYLDKFPQIKHLTVFAFSSENWKRSAAEVNSLMSLFYSFLKKYKHILLERKVRLRVIGKRNKFSNRLNNLIVKVEEETINFTRQLVLAVDYGGRWDIVNAAKAVIDKVERGELTSDQINEETFGQHIAISDIPAPDLLIRTGGEQRISNFLLWQIAYSELYITEEYWPDFDESLLRKALEDFWGRNRRYGGNRDD